MWASISWPVKEEQWPKQSRPKPFAVWCVFAHNRTSLAVYVLIQLLGRRLFGHRILNRRGYPHHVCVVDFVVPLSLSRSAVGDPAAPPPSVLVADLGSSELEGLSRVVASGGRAAAALFILLL